MKKRQRSKKTSINGIAFDSITEAEYYRELLAYQESGLIKDIEAHPCFDLISPFSVRGKRVQGMQYTPDFMYYDIEKNQTVVAEVKGYARPDYLMRRKLFLYFYGDKYIFHEIKKQKKYFHIKEW